MALKDGVHRLVGELDLLMVKKYGTIPTWAQTRLDQAGPEQLETWADAILEAETLEALLGETPRH
ncbi:hypothetical protein [Ectothiorhodospira sp. PHS-1]|uniref:hypothetical protein n=1 Tax=Ectothiorhodospira sp. PHS-1 TaxID=519989 RepID=UPI001439F238|nr:hypothetical protein [Ectothiorhodospira sp. PHS-1]